MTFETLMNNGEFRKKIENAKDLAEIKELLSKAGVELSEEDLGKMLLPDDENLSEEDLENVVGGGAFIWWLRFLTRQGGGNGAFGGGGGGSR